MKRIFTLIAALCALAVPVYSQTAGQATEIRTRTTDPANCSTATEIYGNTATGEVKGCVATNTFEPFATKPGIQKNSYMYSADTGAANAYVATLTPAPAAYTVGMGVYFKAVNANTGASTLNVNGLGIVTIVKNGSTALVSGDIKASQIVHVVYDGTNFELISWATSASGGGTPGGTANSLQYNNAGAFGGVASPTANGDYPCLFHVTASASVAPTCPQSGLSGRSITAAATTDTVAFSDNLTAITHDKAATGAVNETLPTATTLGNPNFAYKYSNHSAQVDTITPTTWTIQSGSLAAAASLSVASGVSCSIKVDPNSATNWLADCAGGSAGGGGTTGINTSFTRYILPAGNSGQITVLGDAASGTAGTLSDDAPTATTPIGVHYVSAATLNSNAGAMGQTVYAAGNGGDAQFQFLFPATATVRYWIGFTSCTAGTMVSSAGPAVASGCKYVAVRFDTSVPDANPVCRSGDGTADGTVITPGTTITNATFHKGELIDNGTSWTLKIDGTSVCTYSANLPAAATPLRFMWMGQTLAASAINMDFYGEQNVTTR